MRLIYAESGQRGKLDWDFNEGVPQLKQAIAEMTDIPVECQILLTPKGMQLRDQINSEIMTVVVYNRRHLDEPNHTELAVIMKQWIPTTERELEPNNTTMTNVNIDESIQKTAVDVCTKHNRIAKRLAKENRAQTIALEAALNNLHRHVRAAGRTLEKFNKIAQKQFAKYAIALASIDLDMDLLTRIDLHPRLATPRIQKLSDCIPIFLLRTSRQSLLETYDGLVKKVADQQQQIVWLQQEAEQTLAYHRSSEESSREADKARNEIVSLYEDVINSYNIPGTISAAASPSSTTNPAYLDNASSVDRLVRLESEIREKLNCMLDLKRKSIVNFFELMHAVSDIEGSIASAFPNLANLEQEIKVLRANIDSVEQAVKKVIAGYGTLLIELWRRDKYTEIILKNTQLLTQLFRDFTRAEYKYRETFQTEVHICNEDSLLHGLLDVEDGTKLVIPFVLVPDQNNNTPVTCKMTASYNQEVSDIVVQKQEIEDYIQWLHTFYDQPSGMTSATEVSTDQDNRKATRRTMLLLRDVPGLLSDKLEREVKRLEKALVSLGLPVTKLRKDIITDRKQQEMVSASSPATLHLSRMEIQQGEHPGHFYTNTLYQSTPSMMYGNWDIEKVLCQSREYRERAEQLEQKLSEERILYKSHRETLLQQIKSTEEQMEQKVLQVTNFCQAEIAELQRQLDYERRIHKQDKDEWKRRSDSMVQSEQKKSERRISGFQERLSAKDAEYAKLQADLDQVRSAPNSPIQRALYARRYQGEVEWQARLDMQKLRQDRQMERLRDDHSQKLQELREISEHVNPRAVQLIDAWLRGPSCSSTPPRAATPDSHISQDTQESISEYRNKLEQMETEMSRMKSLFLADGNEIARQHRSEMSRLSLEHKKTIENMRAMYENKYDVLKIEHQAKLDAKPAAPSTAVSDQSKEEQQLRRECVRYKKKATQSKRELDNAHRLARELISVSNPEETSIDAPLTDLLKKAISTVSCIHSHCNSTTQSIETPYMAYGY